MGLAAGWLFSGPKLMKVGCGVNFTGGRAHRGEDNCGSKQHLGEYSFSEDLMIHLEGNFSARKGIIIL